MFSLFKNTRNHELYGKFKYESKSWVNSDSSILGQSNVELIVPGNLLGLSKKGISKLLELETDFEFKKSELAEILFNDHYLATKQAIESGILKTLVEKYPEISSQKDVWNHARITRVWVDRHNQDGDIEIAIKADWDIEQTLGFTFKSDEQIEFVQNVDI